MSLRQRLKRLERSSGGGECAGCAVRQLTMQMQYELPDGELITLPPIPDLPPCTCRNPRKEQTIVGIIIRLPGTVPSREEAERQYAVYAAANRPWRPEGDATV